MTSLSGLEEVLAAANFEPRGQRFRRSDPGQEAFEHWQGPAAMPVDVDDDMDGVETSESFNPITTDRPYTAIDAGVVSLGWLPDGQVCALRAAAITHYPDGRISLDTYRPDIVVLNQTNRLRVLHEMGRALGVEDFYVKVERGKPVEEKIELGPHDHRLRDRFRNFLERLVQRDVCDRVSDGLILIDGSLTLRTYDTPGKFLQSLHATAQERDLSLVGISKHTTLTLRGIDIRLLLESDGGLPARRRLTRALKLEAASRKQKKNPRGAATVDKRLLGDVYVARFAPAGDVYRVDVAPEPGFTSARVLDELAASCRFRNGYPEALVEAHLFSYLPPPLVAQLQAHAVAAYGLIPVPEPRLAPVFAPFGGRWKS